jgi:hypothetical protein
MPRLTVDEVDAGYDESGSYQERVAQCLIEEDDAYQDGG